MVNDLSKRKSVTILFEIYRLISTIINYDYLLAYQLAINIECEKNTSQ